MQNAQRDTRNLAITVYTRKQDYNEFLSLVQCCPYLYEGTKTKAVSISKRHASAHTLDIYP